MLRSLIAVLIFFSSSIILRINTKLRKQKIITDLISWICILNTLAQSSVEVVTVEANILDCDILLNELELQSPYSVHFRNNALGKVIYPLNPLLCLKLYQYCLFIRMNLVLDNSETLIGHKTKKENKTKPKLILSFDHDQWTRFQIYFHLVNKDSVTMFFFISPSPN